LEDQEPPPQTLDRDAMVATIWEVARWPVVSRYTLQQGSGLGRAHDLQVRCAIRWCRHGC
jgi:hypothetical protein